MPIEPNAGLVVANRYRLDRLLGEGGMGAVWAATHTITHKTLALKFLKAPENHRAELTRRFLREARSACAVEHPNIVQVYDVLELDDGMPVMVMEMLAGESLQQKLRRVGRLQLGELADVMLRVCSAVGTAHAAGIVHRDLKPDNIFLAQMADGSTTVKVLDFGIAKAVFGGEGAGSQAGLTNTGTILGTPAYMSPEQVGGEKDLDHRSDIWSLGIIFYQCLAGVVPTDGENLGQVLKVIMVGPIAPITQFVAGLPPEICYLIDRMLCRDRAGRPSTCREVFEPLEPYAGGGRRSVVSPVAAAPTVLAETAVLPAPAPGASASGPRPVLSAPPAWPSSSANMERAPVALRSPPAPVSAPIPVPVPAPVRPVESLAFLPPSWAPPRPAGPGAPLVVGLGTPQPGVTQAPISVTVPGLSRRPQGVVVALVAIGLAAAGAGTWVLVGLRGDRTPGAGSASVAAAPSPSAASAAPEASAPTAATATATATSTAATPTVVPAGTASASPSATASATSGPPRRSAPASPPPSAAAQPAAPAPTPAGAAASTKKPPGPADRKFE